jgi:hypothetical protein
MSSRESLSWKPFSLGSCEETSEKDEIRATTNVFPCCRTMLSRAQRAPLELLLLHYADEEQLAATMESMLLGTPEGQAAL